MRLGAGLVLSGAFALGTVLGGWWVVPLIGGLWGACGPRRRSARLAGWAAIGAWALLVAVAGLAGPLGSLLHLLGEIVGVPGWVLLGATLLYGGLLAAVAAGVVRDLREVVRRRW